LTGICCSLALAVVGCGKGETTPAASIAVAGTATAGESGIESTSAPSAKAGKQDSAAAKARAQANNFPEVILKTTHGEIHLRLNAEKAPRTVDNFLANYARRGFYDGTIVHYVQSGDMLIAGGFTADFEPKPTRAPIVNEATNGLLHKRGTIAMIRDPEYAQSATSQFFINLKDNAAFDHRGTETSEEYGYCVFGEVVSGMDVVDAIASAEVHDQGDFVSTPVTPIVIQAVEQVK
jgi:cyclophilin family peptidyl-prolyl cis-trans isomerase